MDRTKGRTKSGAPGPPKKPVRKRRTPTKSDAAIAQLLSLPDEEWSPDLAQGVLLQVMLGDLLGRNLGKLVTKANRIMDGKKGRVPMETAAPRNPGRGLYARHLSPEQLAVFDAAVVGSLDYEIEQATRVLEHLRAQALEDPKNAQLRVRVKKYEELIRKLEGTNRTLKKKGASPKPKT